MNTAAENTALTGWRRARLKDLGTVVGGGTPSRTRPEYWEGPIPWASVKDFSDEKLFLEDTAEHISEAGLLNSASTLVPADTPVLCTRMAVGRCALTTRPIAINQDLKALLLRVDLDRRFFVRALGYHGRQLESVSIGSTVRGVTLPDLLSLELCFPESRAEQTRIAAVLDAVDDAIAKTEAVIAKLKQVRAGLMHDLLTRGLDDNGELRDPIAHPEQFKDSPLGRIPKEWEVRRVQDLLARVPHALRSGPFGSALLKHELQSSGVPLLGIDNVHTERFVDMYTRFVSEQKFLELQRYEVRPRDVMVTIMGTVGRCCVVPDAIGAALSSKHVWTITFDQERYSPFLACWQINFAPWVLRQFRRDEQGGTMSAIRSETIRSLLLPVPPPEEFREIEQSWRDATDAVAAEEDVLAKLRTLKSGLLSDLLTGRVRVPEDLLADEGSEAAA